MSDSEVVMKSAVHDFHVYGASWNLIPGKQLKAERELGKPKDSGTDLGFFSYDVSMLKIFSRMSSLARGSIYWTTAQDQAYRMKGGGGSLQPLQTPH